MKAKGGLSKLITFLGWFIDTRRLTISLLSDKWKNWTAQINLCLTKESVGRKELPTLIGRLNHVCYIILGACHFMNHLRDMELIAKANRTPVTLTAAAKANLRLWLEFLASAKNRISLN